MKNFPAPGFGFAVISVGLVFSFLVLNDLTAQVPKIPETVLKIAEDLAADDSDPELISDFAIRLGELSEEPVRINSGNEEEISRLFFLSDFQVKALADYVRTTGKILSIFEIQNIPGFDRETARMMSSFITLDFREQDHSDSLPGKSTFLTNFSFTGNQDSTYIGSPVKILTRYKFLRGPVAAGFTAEKDQGELFFSGKPPSPDFLSGYISFRGTGVIKRIIVGDFSARFGQGIMINTGFPSFFSLSSQTRIASGNEIRNYTSTDENNFFRGAGVMLSSGKTDISLFFSENKIDATTGPDGISSFYTTGLHNDSLSIMKKDAVKITTVGAEITLNLEKIRFGAACSGDALSLPVKKDLSDPEKVFAFSGDRNYLSSVFYDAIFEKLLLCGEASLDRGRYLAFTQGLSWRVSDRLSLSGFYIDFKPGFFSLHGRSPLGGSSVQNEKAYRASFYFEAAKYLFISGGAQQEYFPWLKYRCSSPSRGDRSELSIKFNPSASISLDATYSSRYSETNSPGEVNGIPQLSGNRTQTIRLATRYSPTDNLAFTTRFNFVKAEPSANTGMLLLEDASVRMRKMPVSFWVRYCIFNSTGWDSRLYAYENDLLYSYSIPALSGIGMRNYFIVRWDPGHFADLRFKYGVTSIWDGMKYQNKEEFKIQVKITF